MPSTLASFFFLLGGVGIVSCWGVLVFAHLDGARRRNDRFDDDVRRQS